MDYNKETPGYSLLATLWQRHINRKQIKNITKENEIRRGIVKYQPTHIEYFFDSSQEIDDALVSVENEEIRCRAAVSQAICAYNKGIPVVVLHEGDYRLEQGMRAAFSTNNAILTFNSAYPFYDPFKGICSKEITNLIVEASKGISDIRYNGQYYIEALTSIIAAKAPYPYCKMYMSCPFDKLLEKATDLNKKNALSKYEYERISSLMMQGQEEKANIEKYLWELDYEASYIMAGKANLNYAFSLQEIIDKRCVGMLDIQNIQNEALVNIAVEDIKQALRKGKEVLLIIDSIMFTKNQGLRKVIEVNSGKCKKMLVGADIYSMMESDDKHFSNFMANCKMAIIGAHKSMNSCRKWSDYIGQYDKNEVSMNFGGHSSFHQGYGFGSDYSYSVNQKKEDILSPEEIYGLSSDEILVLNQKKHKLLYTQLV